MLPVNFTPGPSQVYFTAEDHIRQAFRDGIPSISHRSKTFESIYREAKEGLYELLNIPDGWHMVFTSSATEVWERSIENLVTEKCHHFVNGAFSEKYFDFAMMLGKNAETTQAPAGSGFGAPATFPGSEMIAVTQNETSTGVSVQNDWIAGVRSSNPEALIIVDGVSALPHLQPEFSKIDSLFFSVQKGFGMPAGLGIWLLNDRCIEKSDSRARAGYKNGTYHTIASLISNAKKFQTPSTPNVLGIYLFSKICGDFLRRGIDTIRRETAYKSTLLYNALDNHEIITPLVKHKPDRSQTVIVADTGDKTREIFDFLLKSGLQAGEGYGEGKKTQLRFANFPAHSKEVFEKLTDLLARFN